jgi:hypothetical protein
VPEVSFPHSVAVLDNRRLNKQITEAIQLLNAMRRLDERDAALVAGAATAKGAVEQFKRIGWSAHPALIAWRGYAPALALYTTFAIREWLNRGFNNNRPPPYDADWQPNPAAEYAGQLPPAAEVVLPPWLGDNLIHATHRSNLLRKEPVWYEAYGWSEGPDLAYIWPDPKDYNF